LTTRNYFPLLTRSFTTVTADRESGPERSAEGKSSTKSTTVRKKTARKAKAKSKSKAKPKPKRRVLTPVQKELLKRRKQKEEMTKLKEQALKLPYLKPASAYRLFIQQQLPTLEGPMPERFKKISEMWKQISPSELEVSHLIDCI
jgi:hypothetical protein